jgi:NADH dehydrogenase [ubiquinone] 1 alpha subcomplex assembly factor 5
MPYRETMDMPFNRQLLRLRRDRTALRFSEFDFLFVEAAERLIERLDVVKRGFPLALDIGCHDGVLGRKLLGRYGVERLFSCDISPKMAKQAGQLAFVADEEMLPLRETSLDLVISGLSLHWVNDLPGALLQIRRILRPDGLFIASLLGGRTLSELRQVFLEAEVEISNGASPRVAPFADVRDLGGLLQRAGFIEPVVDSETIIVSYADPLRLIADLRGMGESAVLNARRPGLSRRDVIFKAASLYKERFAGEDGRIPASFEILTVTGWVAPG